MRIPFVGPTYNSRSPNLACDRSINFYPELAPEGSKDVIALCGTAGTQLKYKTGDSPLRAMHVVGDVLYVVRGAALLAISARGEQSALLGSLDTIVGRVSMADNGLRSVGLGGNQILLADGTAAYLYDIKANTFVRLSFPGLSPSHCVFLDGYFILSFAGTLTLRCSDLFDGATWNELATVQVSATPEPIETIKDLTQQLWIIKRNSSECWYDVGVPTSVGFPFARISGAVLDVGTEAPFSVVRSGNSLLLLGTIRANNAGEFAGVVMITGYSHNIVSPAAITYQIGQWRTRSDVFAYCYSEGGHTFYILTSPAANQTFVYDFATQMWHERSTYDGAPYKIGRHVSNCYAYFNGLHLVGDYRNGNVYTMSSSIYTDNEDPIVSVRQVQHLFDRNGLDNVFIHRLQVDVETGIAEGPAYASLAWSDDGGHTFSSDYPVSMGKRGEYSTELIWRRLGYTRDRVFRLMIAGSMKKIIIGAVAEMSK